MSPQCPLHSARSFPRPPSLCSQLPSAPEPVPAASLNPQACVCSFPQPLSLCPQFPSAPRACARQRRG
eukprot:gene7461-602_t